MKHITKSRPNVHFETGTNKFAKRENHFGIIKVNNKSQIHANGTMLSSRS